MSDEAETPLPALIEPRTDGKVMCEDCGLWFMPAGMGVHRAAAHGYRGPKSKRRGSAPSKGTVTRTPKIDLTVDEIFEAVVSQMFPRGTIPVAALTPLLRWRHATDEMLIEVQGHAK